MEVTVELGGTGVMVVQVISEATVALERATVALARITAVLVKALEVLERAMEALEDMEGVSGKLEDMLVLDIHLMASEEDTLEWAHTLMAVQVLFMECQDMGRSHTAHRLQLMVHKLLLTTHNHKLMTHNLLHLMQPLPHNHLKPMEALELALLQGRLMTQLLQPMHLLHTVFLPAMVFGIQYTNLYKVVSYNSLRSNQGLINSLLQSLLQGQCDVFTMLFHLIKTSSLNLDCR